MTQEYTPVSWQDETTSQQGTLINAERLNQMQTAHHFADGLEEVDAVPTADPGVAYHKIVYCTADNTLYRWNGTEWTKDIDDDTKALLLEHEADHDNPHEVTKAQVGLGNADNTADLDKPISTATQTALNAKADKATTYTKAQTDTLLAGKVDKQDSSAGMIAYTAEEGTEGSTEVSGTAKPATIPIRTADGRLRAYFDDADPYADDCVTYAWTSGQLADIRGTLDYKADKSDTYTKAEIDTALATKADDNAVVHLAGAETIPGTKTFSSIIYHAQNGNQYDLVGIRTDMDITALTGTGYKNILKVQDKNGEVFTAISSRIYTDQSSKAFLTTLSAGNVGQTSEIATVATLDGYEPMVRTTGNQNIGGNKNLTGETIISGAFNNKCKYYGYVNAAANYERIATITPGALGGAFVGMIYSTKGQSTAFKNRHGIFYARVRNNDLQIIWMVKGGTIVEKQLYLTYDGSTFELWGLVNYDAANEAMGFTLLSESNAGSIPYPLVHVDSLEVVKTEAELSQYQLSSYST